MIYMLLHKLGLGRRTNESIPANLLFSKSFQFMQETEIALKRNFEFSLKNRIS